MSYRSDVSSNVHDVITNPNDVSKKWLAGTLQSRSANATALTITDLRSQILHQSTSSIIYRLNLVWDSQKHELPTNLCLKLAQLPKNHSVFREIDFYQNLAPNFKDGPFPLVLHCDDDGINGHYHLLMHDYSKTHKSLTSRMPPDVAEATMIVTSLAKLHAFWWDDPELGNDVGTIPSEFDFRRNVGFASAHLKHVFDVLGDRISRNEQITFERICANAYSALRDRLRPNAKNLTLVHGDAHAKNFLVPRNQEANSTLIIDWQKPDWVWEVCPGASDLANLFVRFWSPRRRKQVERALLQAYLHELQKKGVNNYQMSQLEIDYRWSVVLVFFAAIHDLVAQKKDNWYVQMENCISAVLELDCVELF